MRQAHTLRGVLALSALAAALAVTAPAQAQNAACTPGAFGEGGKFRVNKGDDNKVTAATVEYQCSETLADGTFAPEGYRLILEGKCGAGGCNYPTLIAKKTARDGFFQTGFVQDGKDVNINLRAPRNGREGIINMSMITRAPEKGAKRERARYRLRAR
ncbi:hypothetical protein RDV64_22235 [Acuticoccus sp. MNP-M23]|uniref:hypothetical protein n=1 Tax=Acuticoccus sp. MNP-M23 TaxID=3072793 RepID=UPI0028158E18|nr:hypothetical protein [Acuticoccus sp. MNP-M23]WMS42740.1 hypothetical protein RDV64_22235 [Acuticoccus sp. MNP-M23]